MQDWCNKPINRSPGFSLIECLIVIAIIALLMAITLPCLGRARLQAKTVTVNLELRQIGIALDLYWDDHDRKAPPTRTDCSLGWGDHQLPPELAEGGYLPKPPEDSNLPVAYEDRFHRGQPQTYRYWAVGDLMQNGAPSAFFAFYSLCAPRFSPISRASWLMMSVTAIPRHHR